MPEKRSRTEIFEKSYWLARVLNSPSLAKSVVGRALNPFGGMMYLPRSVPPIILMILKWEG